MTQQNETRGTRADVTVLPMRFTGAVARMRDFLTLLGLSPQVSRDEDWITMAGEAGMVALHSVPTDSPDERAGRTILWFETSDLESLRESYTAAGFEDTDVYDEAYGRVLTVRDRHGRELGFDQPSDDLYGYRLDEPDPRHGILAMPVLFEDPAGVFGLMVQPAGFTRLDHGDDERWRVWGSRGGLIALCRPTDAGDAGSVRLGFRTREPLRQLADRLVDAGYSDATVTDEHWLTVTDPDGQPVHVRLRVRDGSELPGPD